MLVHFEQYWYLGYIMSMYLQLLFARLKHIWHPYAIFITFGDGIFTILFNIDFRFLDHGRKKSLFLHRELIGKVNGQNHHNFSHLGPIIRKKLGKSWSIWLKKISFIPNKNNCFKKIHNDSDTSSDAFSYETNRFWKKLSGSWDIYWIFLNYCLAYI